MTGSDARLAPEGGERRPLGGLGGPLLVVASMASVLAAYTLAPRVSGALTGGSPGLYYGVLLGVDAALAATVYAIYRLVEAPKPWGRLFPLNAGSAALLAAGLAGGYMLVAGILGFRATGIRGILGSLLVDSIYAAIAVPAALGVAASKRLGGWGPLVAAVMGLLVLNPASLAGLLQGGGPQGALGALVEVVLGILLGLLALTAAEALGPAGGYSVLAGSLVAMAGIPVRPAGGALGLLVAGLTGYYTAYTALSIMRGGSPLGGLAAALRGGAGGTGNGGGGPGGGGPPRPLYRRPSCWALCAVAALLVGLALSGVMVWQPLVVVTGSMRPSLNPGDVVILRKVDPSAVRVGDVIAYRVKHVIVMHRVVGVNSDGTLVTKGDANNAPDPWPVRPSDIVGKLWLRVPLIGWLVILADWNPLTRIIAVAVTAAVLAYIVIRW